MMVLSGWEVEGTAVERQGHDHDRFVPAADVDESARCRARATATSTKAIAIGWPSVGGQRADCDRADDALAGRVANGVVGAAQRRRLATQADQHSLRACHGGSAARSGRRNPCCLPKTTFAEPGLVRVSVEWSVRGRRAAFRLRAAGCHGRPGRPGRAARRGGGAMRATTVTAEPVSAGTARSRPRRCSRYGRAGRRCRRRARA